MKTTRGPWRSFLAPGEPITAAIQPGRRQDEWRVEPVGKLFQNGGAIVASVYGPDAEANARLIAAAPQMFDDISAFVAHMDKCESAEEAAEIAKDTLVLFRQTLTSVTGENADAP